MLERGAWGSRDDSEVTDLYNKDAAIHTGPSGTLLARAALSADLEHSIAEDGARKKRRPDKRPWPNCRRETALKAKPSPRDDRDAFFLSPRGVKGKPAAFSRLRQAGC